MSAWIQLSKLAHAYPVCQRHSSPTELGYFDIACRRSKTCCTDSLKLGYFLFACSRQLFSLHLPVSCHFKEILSPLMSKNFLSSISVIKRSWRAISIDYPLHQKFYCFLPNWVILVILLLKSILILETGLLWSRLPQARKPICRRFGSLATLHAYHLSLKAPLWEGGVLTLTGYT